MTNAYRPRRTCLSVPGSTLEVGEQPEGYTEGDAYHHVLMTILVATRPRDRRGRRALPQGS